MVISRRFTRYKPYHPAVQHTYKFEACIGLPRLSIQDIPDGYGTAQLVYNVFCQSIRRVMKLMLIVSTYVSMHDNEMRLHHSIVSLRNSYVKLKQRHFFYFYNSYIIVHVYVNYTNVLLNTDV